MRFYLKFHHFREGLWAFPKRPKWLLNRILIGFIAKFRATHPTVDWTKEGTIARYLLYNSGGKSHLSHCGSMMVSSTGPGSHIPRISTSPLARQISDFLQRSFKEYSFNPSKNTSELLPMVQIRDRSFVSSYEFDSQWPGPNRIPCYRASKPTETNGIQWDFFWGSIGGPGNT